MSLIFCGGKKPSYYKGLLMRADDGLHEQIVSAITGGMTKGARVLDLGAGEGALSARLADAGYQVVAADIDGEGFKAEGVDFRAIDFDSAEEIEHFVAEHELAFDVVCGVEVIEHLENQWAYIRNLKRMLKPGGMLVVTTPNVVSWLSRLQFLLTGRFHQFADADLAYGHISPITPAELGLILRREGFDHVDVLPGGTLPPLYFSGIKLTLASLLALLVRPFQRGLLDGWCVIGVGRKR